MGTTKREPGIAGRRWARVRELFEQACERPADDREAWLRVACSGDEALLEEVRSLLSADARAVDLEPPSGGLRGVDAADRSGMPVGPYVLDHLLGTGGMGAVYLAHRADQAFEKEVAVKLIKRGMDTDDILRRFHNERQVLAGLEHPGVARLLDGGSTEDGLPYLVMEHVEGVPLDRWCDEQHLGVRRRIELFRKICEAVDFAHRRGVVHRDLKPSNVLVTAVGEPKLLDFGIAKIVEPVGSTGTVNVTATELRLMTPEYASPEQVRGEPIGPPSDVYSLGVSLYELLTGRHPHPTTTRLRMDLERAICHEDPPPPSTAVLRPPTGRKGDAVQALTAEEISRRRGRTTRALRRELAGDVDTIVLKALRKEPERRYATAGELADDLGRLLAGLPVLARPDTWHYRAGKLLRRNKGLVASTLTVIAALLVGVVVSTTLFLQAERARRASVEREYVARMSSAAAALENQDVNRARRDLELAPQSERGWEWRHLMARTDRSDETLTDLGRGVILRSVAFDSEGRWMVVGGQDNTVHLFDRLDGNEVARRSLPWIVKSLTFLDEGSRLVTVSEGRAVHALAVPSLEPLARHQPAGTGYLALSSPASREWLACSRADGRIDVLDPDSLEVRRTFGIQEGAINIAASPDGALLATGGASEDLVVWDAWTGEPRFDPILLPSSVSSLAFTPDGSAVAVSLGREGNREVLLVESASGRVVARAVGHLSTARGVRFHPDGTRLATGALDETIRIWSVPELRPLQVLLGHGSAISDLAHDPITDRLVSVDADGRTKAWSWGADEVRGWMGQPGWHMGLDVSPDSTRVVTMGRIDTKEGRRGTIEVRNVATGIGVWSAVLEETVGFALSFSPDGSRIAFVTTDGRVEVWDALSGQRLASAPAGGNAEGAAAGTLRDLAYSADGRTLITAGPGASGWVHDARTLEPLTRLDTHHHAVWTVSADPRGELLVTGGSGDPAVSLWSAGAGLLRATLIGHTDGVVSSAFHPSGELVATGSTDKTIRLWSISEGLELALLEGHTQRVMGLDFSPDGTRLASCSFDGTVRIWSIPDGQEVAALRGHRDHVRDVRFAPDGSFLASLSVDGELRIWDAPAPDLDPDD